MKYLYRIYQLIIFLPLFLVITIICALLTIVGCTLGGSRFWGYYPGKIWSYLTCRLLLLPIKVEGRNKLDKHASYVFVANHQGAMDIFLIYGFLQRNFKWMMKKSLKKIPLVGFACQKARFIFVDRSSQHGIKQTITDARKTLSQSMSLMVFPEGSRTFDGKMRPFSKGAFLLADELQLPVVPITITGSFEVLPRTKGFNFVNFHRMRLIIHDPIPPQGQGSDNMHALSQMSFSAIQSAL
ncbi:MAG: 1-acyl-sn-glycerol-3-phosphate acyltransferase [Bacteroidaceae bacterium]|nr:1-acyl-sn-glycerol-3-phosphate acyltransferase [Bacteroidaceae bacterium]MBO4592734.1 1-acyl-sn-glycerol-3-phosphate acyltransferase [Bacteroidaceae bacterium]MBR4782799.1 1-acyl-sn-glycerol-3-phosphate acyltransferase [Bacteroidaceae bacterium]